MSYLYLSAAVFCLAFAGVFGGFYNRKNEKNSGASATYNLVQVACAFVLWCLLFFTDFSFDYRVLGYALLFSVFYVLYTLGMIQALRIGPVALTSLFLQLSNIGVTVWGFCFWGEEITLFSVLGLVLVAITICLCLYTGKKSEEKVNVKWLLYVSMVFVGNAGCCIVQRNQQTAFDGMHRGLFMCAAMAVALAVCFLLFLKSDKTQVKKILKTSWGYPVGGGICNVALNVFVMLLAVSTLSPTVIYPVLSVGGLVVTMFFSLLVFKEKLHWWQWLGVGVGILAVGILSV